MSSSFTHVHDLTHLVGPLTEESLVKCLQARFNAGLCQTCIGPQLVCINPFTFPPNLKALQNERSQSHARTPSNQSTNGEPTNPSQSQTRPPGVRYHPNQSVFMSSMVRSVLSQHADSLQPQIVLLSGENGSGKTECSLEVLRQLYELAGGGCDTDTFKFLCGSLTALRSLITAASLSNPNSSRMGIYIENLVSDCLVYRTKIHGLIVDPRRVTNIPRRERNYHIFYQMLAGMGQEEKVKLHLNGFSVQNLRYLSEGAISSSQAEDKAYFESWRNSMSVLGIPVSDVLRVLTSVLLLGNVQFVEGVGQELEVCGNNELKSVSALLGVSGVSLYRGFTTQTRLAHGQVCRTITDASTANCTRDSLARALYFRTVSAILRRVNSLKRGTSYCTQSSESQESRGSSQYNSKPDILNPTLPSFLGLSLSKKSSESFIGILDLFGFEAAEVNMLEQLCINLCAEAMQHYYNTHVFRCPSDALREECIYSEVDITYFNNTPVIELLSAQMNGLLTILDDQTLAEHASPKTYVEEIRRHHMTNNYFFEPLPKNDRLFGIRHFTGRLVYDTSCFLSSNQDHLPDDIIHVFARQNCNFGFVSHLFASEMRPSPDGIVGPIGAKCKSFPNHQSDCESPDHAVRSTLSSDFQSRLESILKSVTTAKPHFIRCIKSNDFCQRGVFECETVSRQVRSLQITEAVQLMAGGLPHRLRYKSFNQRYYVFQPYGRLKWRGKSPQEECKAILSHFLRAMDESRLPYISTQWTLGRKHIFYSEGTRQSLEAMRQERLSTSAARIQAAWRAYRVRRSLRPQVINTKQKSNKPAYNTNSLTPMTPRPQLPPKGDKIEKVEPAVLNYVCKLWNIDPTKKPALPPRRNYSVHGNVVITFPQCRCMKITFPENGPPNDVFKKGDIVTVLGPSVTKGHLMAQRGDIIHHVPFIHMDVQSVQTGPGGRQNNR